MKLWVAEEGWGEAQPQDVKRLLSDTTSHLARHIRDPVEQVIRVERAPVSDPEPRTLYRDSLQDPITVRLEASDRHWAQFAFQFSHEFCHILSGYERLKENPNHWFHEAICELASLFTLRRMAEEWPTNPPYPHWSDYSPSLASYAEERLQRPEHRLPPGLTVSGWLASEEDALRADPYQREKNAIVAGALLPLFESDPTGWNAIRFFPQSSSPFKAYLAEWHEEVEHMDGRFVERISQLMEQP